MTVPTLDKVRFPRASGDRPFTGTAANRMFTVPPRKRG